VRAVDLAGCAALLAPGLDELAGLVELDDAGIGVAAVTSATKMSPLGATSVAEGALNSSAPLLQRRVAERQQQLAVRAELEDLVAYAFLT